MRATPRRLALVLCVLLLFALLAPGAEGALFWRTAGQEALVPAPAVRTDVEIRVTGIVARARVRQEFTNPSGEWAEGVYVFPLPDEAAVDRLRLRVGAGEGGRGAADGGRDPRARGGEGALRAGAVPGPAREPRRAGAPERLHDHAD